MRFKLPPVFAINETRERNTLQQLIAPTCNIEGALANYQGPTSKGKLIVPDDAKAAEILVVEKLAMVPIDFAKILQAKIDEVPITNKSDSGIDLTENRWLRHPMLPGTSELPVGYKTRADEAIGSWLGSFSYVAENHETMTKGLRSPQIGALHMVHGHWTVSDEAATIVMPTGTGKTDTMLSVLVSKPCQRVLMVVPTDALRAQIANKFLTLGILKDPDCHILLDSARYPVVGVLRRKPKDLAEVDSFFQGCNVIVTTSHIAGQCDEQLQERMAYHCPFLFIDEAHHVEAPTWRAFKQKFSSSKVLQFTATPFREDDRPVDGKIIYKYPLKKAQEENYFKPIRFEPIVEFNPAKADEAIAAKAVEQLRRDQKYNHIVMARVGSVERAGQVFSIYKKYEEFKPVEIHTGIKSKKAREEIRRKILSLESRIVVCVDMLGEGFDLPELKIAALHDIRKSLAVTLQLAGRFTRSRPDLGEATFIANVADVDVQDELRKLYTREPDWNCLLPELSEAIIQEQVSLNEFLEGFANFPNDIPLKRVKPATSTVVYKTKCEQWTPENFRRGIPGVGLCERVESDINYYKNTLVVVTARRVPIEWAEIDEIYNWGWELYVVIWDEKQKLLFINNSSNEGDFKSLAKAVAGDDVQLVNEQAVFRSFAGVNRLRLQNVGLTEQIGRLIRYTGRMGADVEAGLTEAQKRNARKAVLCGTGFENGKKVTVGASRKGRIWSFRKAHLEAMSNWCKSIGAKVLDESIDPDEILKGTLESKAIAEIPKIAPIGIDWPEEVYKESETSFALILDEEAEWPLHYTDIALIDQGPNGEIKFEITSDDSSFQMSLALFMQDDIADYRFAVDGSSKVSVKHRSSRIPIQDFFYQNPPVVWFVDGASLEGNTFTPLKVKYPLYLREKIVAWDWDGVDLTKESQGVTKEPESIQFRVIKQLKEEDYDVIFDDDGTGEAADVVAIKIAGESIKQRSVNVEFYHCKFSKKDPGQRIKDLYEVCGQAQKSIRWMYSHEKQVELFTHLMRREPKTKKGKEASRFEAGDRDKLITIREMSRVCPLDLRIFVVQPGLSRKNATVEQLELLSVTENHLMETYKLRFGVIASA